MTAKTEFNLIGLPTGQGFFPALPGLRDIIGMDDGSPAIAVEAAGWYPTVPDRPDH